MVERPLSMREVPGSIPGFSTQSNIFGKVKAKMLFRQCSFKTTFFDSSKTSYFIAYPGLIQLAKIAALDGEFVNKGFKNCQ